MKTIKSVQEFNDFIDKFDVFLFDCDGVIWQGDKLIQNSAKALSLLSKLGKKVLFVTNNSTKSRIAYLQKFEKLGIETSVKSIFGSAYCAAYYIKHTVKLPPNKKVYVCGMSGIRDELMSFGINCAVDNDDISDMSGMDKLQLDPDVAVVLFGFDFNVTYLKLAKAYKYLSNQDVLFLATNDDLTFPVANFNFPGTGALLAALKAPLGREPVVLGKPHQTMLDCIVDEYTLDRHKTCMVGDRLDTDIAFGRLGGLGTLLVMSGVTDQFALDQSKIEPDYLISSLGSFLELK